jgi:hypothetical protein
VSAVVLKRLTPRMSDRVSRFAAAHYSPFYVGTYLARRDHALIEARHASSPEIREQHLSWARDCHRSYLRCLREARRDGLLS